MAMEPLLSKEKLEHRLSETAEGKAQYLVAEKDGKVAGHIFLKFYGKPTATEYPDIEDLYVNPDFRHQGIGESLVKECEKIAKEKGFSQIGIASNPDERCPARLLYKKLEFDVVNNVPYVDGVYEGVEDYVVDLVKDLK